MAKIVTPHTEKNIFLSHVLSTLQRIEILSKGGETDYTENLADLIGKAREPGDAPEEMRLKEQLCSTIESIARNLDQFLKMENTLRRVRISKIRGKAQARVKIESSFEGWEARNPRVRMHYKVYKQDGGIFRSAVITKVFSDHFETKNSLYRIERF